ncbi:unnamed protein product, partial [Brenthis ino]
MFGLGRPIIYKPRHYGYAYPEDLLKVTSAPFIRSPYRNVYQGRRYKGDRRVYNKYFKYPPKRDGHRLFCQGNFDCTIRHLSIQTNGSIPIIFRGGVGYKHFSVIIKADPGVELSGRVKAYCAQSPKSIETVNKNLV